MMSLRVLAVLEAVRVTGVARNVLDYAVLARDCGIDVTLAMIRRRGAGGAPIDALGDAALARGVPVEIILERHRYDEGTVAQLREIVRRRSPDVLETHHVKSHCLLALSGIWRERAWVAFHHGYTQTDLKVRLYNQVDRWSLRFAAHVVTTNRVFARLLAARGLDRSRISVVHNGVYPVQPGETAPAQVRARLGLTPEDRVVLSVGRLSREKGHGDLLRAFARVRAEAPPPVRLVLVGDGPDRPRLEREAWRCRLDADVRFAGHVSQVAPYYAMADVFALPSWSEGSPNALLEAMAWGLPVAATRAGGVPEIAADQVTALLVPVGDAPALAAATRRLLENRVLARRLGEAARASVLRRHTPAGRASVLNGLYASLAGASAPVPALQ
jgi:glycosyltransferase involved in cell wall biosynthesis